MAAAASMEAPEGNLVLTSVRRGWEGRKGALKVSSCRNRAHDSHLNRRAKVAAAISMQIFAN